MREQPAKLRFALHRQETRRCREKQLRVAVGYLRIASTRRAATPAAVQNEHRI